MCTIAVRGSRETTIPCCHCFLAFAKSCGYRRGNACDARGGQGVVQRYECGVCYIDWEWRKKNKQMLRFGEGIISFGLCNSHFNPCFNWSCNLDDFMNLLVGYG